MAEKESSLSGSLGNSETDSPPPAVMNMDVERSVDRLTMVGSGSGDSFGKKKRGRPRKYDLDGNLRLPYSGSSPPQQPPYSPPEFSSKRGRGRPPGSGNWQLLASLGAVFANSAGGDFTPHVVTVDTGEDVAAKIISLAQKGPRGICVLSANGAVSNVTIRQPGSSGGILTYEGRFEILTLSGSFTATDSGGVRSKTGGLSVSLAGPDGRVIGGGIAGLLIASSPIQMVVGSFMPNGYKAHKRKHQREHLAAAIIPDAPDEVANAEPISEIKPDVQTCLAAGFPIPGQSHGEADASPSQNQIPNATLSHNAGWNGPEAATDRRPSPDINLSMPVD